MKGRVLELMYIFYTSHLWHIFQRFIDASFIFDESNLKFFTNYELETMD